MIDNMGRLLPLCGWASEIKDFAGEIKYDVALCTAQGTKYYHGLMLCWTHYIEALNHMWYYPGDK